MLYFSERDESLSTLESLPQIFAIEEAETDLFRPDGVLMEKAGCWGRFLKLLTSSYTLSSRGAICGLQWKVGSQPVQMRYNGSKVMLTRSARWIEVNIASQTLVAALLPHIYNVENKVYADHRFVVGCSDPSVVPLVILFGDHILGQTNDNEG